MGWGWFGMRTRESGRLGVFQNPGLYSSQFLIQVFTGYKHGGYAYRMHRYRVERAAVHQYPLQGIIQGVIGTCLRSSGNHLIRFISAGAYLRINDPQVKG
jgi:hypothetical protein